MKKNIREPSMAASEREDPLLNWTRPSREECPICLLPLPHDEGEFVWRGCCGKTVCNGCVYEHMVVDMKDGIRTWDESSARICPFCRNKATAEDDSVQRDMKLAKAGNYTAMWRIGRCYYNGFRGIHQDKAEGIKWWRRAAESGSPEAAWNLGSCYEEGDVGVEKDIGRALAYYEKAAIGGCPEAFIASGSLLMRTGSIEAGLINYRKAAMCGLSGEYSYIFGDLRHGYRDGYITKEEFAFTLRENQKASNEMKSESREMMKKIQKARERGETFLPELQQAMKK